ncbi:histone chaperone ASF1-like [Prosopis cineraria]|uniref:histone chaperone ASF1-like n=1 Tax=Prosopis cineraria TaxID=364024 RepID=UPI00240EB235|nr:histone chaperone ASF1-like [Prosopis cineraria]
MKLLWDSENVEKTKGYGDEIEEEAHKDSKEEDKEEEEEVDEDNPEEADEDEEGEGKDEEANKKSSEEGEEGDEQGVEENVELAIGGAMSSRPVLDSLVSISEYERRKKEGENIKKGKNPTGKRRKKTG